MGSLLVIHRGVATVLGEQRGDEFRLALSGHLIQRNGSDILWTVILGWEFRLGLTLWRGDDKNQININPEALN